MDDVCEGKDFSFPAQEEKILKYWDEIKAFETQLEKTKDFPEYIFYDGPPFATGLPHYGHILAGTIKDIVTRYQSMTGHHVTRRFGWDCHELPVEHEIDQKLGIKSRDDVLKMGIANYNEECRGIVSRYVQEWEKTVVRMGRWIDFKNDYKTMDLKFMESVWWVFAKLYEKGLVYRGFKVMPYSTGCKTPLANFEANQNYKNVDDPEIMVTFPLVDNEEGAALVAWTTTPWTLPSNLALCVNKEFVYVKVRNKFSGKIYVVAESRLSELPVEKVKKNVQNGPADNSEKLNPKGKSSSGKGKDAETYEVLEKLSGESLVGKKYIPLFDYFKDFSDVAFRVVADDYVTSDSGTGIVHCAPAFGEDDYRVCIVNHIINKSENLVVAVDDDGCFTDRITDFKGRYVKDADKDIIQTVKEKGRLVKSGSANHSYPFCWRSETPLIYRAVPSWFVAVEKIKDQLLENNKQTYWVPDFVKEKRFHNWLENARDWAVSRSRFWGTPLPLWISEDGEEIVVMDSIEKLERLSGVKVTDLHRHNIDHITIPSTRGSGVLKRLEDVFDCWFESGSMPYAYIHYPFENVELFEKNFPGHFVAEGLDQTRGWFYTLMVLSTALFEKPAFRNLICNGLVLAEDGKKMSKRLKNYPPPGEVINDFGADALRLYIINSPVVRAEPLRFKKEGVYGVVKDVFLPWYNAYRFLVQNAKRLEIEVHSQFVPIDQITLQKSSDVLDQWINSATQSLVHFVRQEMDAYRLYTVVPYLLKFLDNLTNIYVRFNRKRLKGRTGEQDCRTALSTLYHVLLISCKAMAPFTPFFTEVLYHNMRKVSNGSEESIHYCHFPEVEGKRGERIEESVSKMMTIIDLARNIRERQNKPLKTPLREMVVVHPDAEFLDDIAGKLREYVLEELNVKSLVSCNDTLKYASLRAEPDFSVLGKRLGKSMGAVANEVKALSTEDILAFEKAGELTIATHTLKLSEIKIVRGFKRPDNMTEKDMDAAGDGDVLVVLDMRQDESLFEAGVAREVVNRIQKLRKKAGLEPTDLVEVFFESLDEDKSILKQILESQETAIRDALGSPLLSSELIPPHAVIFAEERFHGVSNISFAIKLARPSLLFSEDAIVSLYGGNVKYANGLQSYLLSRDHNNLKAEFQAGKGTVSSVNRCPGKMADREDDGPTLRLIIEKGPSEGQIQEFIPKSGSEIKIGRIIRGNTLSIKDVGISSKHASIRFDDSHPIEFWALSDLGSSNGTVLNERLLEPLTPVALSDGDVIKIGELTSIVVKLVEVRDRVEERNARPKIPRRKGRNLEVIDLTKESSLGKGDEGKGNFRGRNTRGKVALQKNEVAEVKGNNEMEAASSKRVTRSGAGKENGVQIEHVEVENLGRIARSRRNGRKKGENGVQDAEEMVSLTQDQVHEAPSCTENKVGGKEKDHDLEILSGNEVQNKDKEGQNLSLRRSTRNLRKEKNMEKSSLKVNGEEKPQRRRGRRKNLGMETLTENDEDAEKMKNSEEEVLLEDMKEGLREEGEEIHEEEKARLQQLASEGCQAVASTSGLVKENDDEIEVDLEKMTLGEWFDFLDVHLPKQIIDETEEMILDMRQKSEKFHYFMLQQ